MLNVEYQLARPDQANTLLPVGWSEAFTTDGKFNDANRRLLSLV